MSAIGGGGGVAPSPGVHPGGSVASGGVPSVGPIPGVASSPMTVGVGAASPVGTAMDSLSQALKANIIPNQEYLLQVIFILKHKLTYHNVQFLFYLFPFYFRVPY